jgi:miniconductance mechanosensitive channel
VFRDVILGFVAGVQIAANDMVRVGDIIEIPQRDIGGTVLDISLVTVKHEAFDKTTISVPAYTFISEPFVNRRGLIDTGARRILRSFNIDANTVRVCDEELVSRLREIPLVSEFAQAGLTNISIFREYLTAYLRARGDIRQDLTVLVRQLQPAEVGIPFEIFVFTAEVDLIPHENIQSDIFEHIYAALPEFDLKLYQRPSGV